MATFAREQPEDQGVRVVETATILIPRFAGASSAAAGESNGSESLLNDPLNPLNGFNDSDPSKEGSTGVR
jgi:hypothetical protein